MHFTKHHIAQRILILRQLIRRFSSHSLYATRVVTKSPLLVLPYWTTIITYKGHSKTNMNPISLLNPPFLLYIYTLLLKMVCLLWDLQIPAKHVSSHIRSKLIQIVVPEILALFLWLQDINQLTHQNSSMAKSHLNRTVISK